MSKKSKEKGFLKAIPLNPRTKRPIRSPKGKDVIYGYRTIDKRVIPLEMESQRFTKTEIRQLQTVLNKSRAIKPPNALFYLKPTNRLEKYKGGEQIKEKIWNSEKNKYVWKKRKAKKDEVRYIYRSGKKAYKAKSLKLIFKAPTYRKLKGKKVPAKYSIVKFIGTKAKIVNYRVQEHGKYDKITSQILTEVSTDTRDTLDKMQRNLQEKLKSQTVVFSGPTLKSTLLRIQPPKSYEELLKSGVTSMSLEVNLKIEGEALNFTLAGIPLSEYSDLTDKLSKAIRTELAGKGVTYTKYNTLKQMKDVVKKHYEAQNQPYLDKWNKTGKIRKPDGKWVDMNSGIDGTGARQLDEIKPGSLSGNVTFRFYAGMKEIDSSGEPEDF